MKTKSDKKDDKPNIYNASVTPTEAIQEEHFNIIEEYMSNGLSGVRAVKTMRPEVSYNTAKVIWHNIAKSDHGRAYITEKRRERRAKVSIMADQLLINMASWLEPDPTIYTGLTPDELRALPYELKRPIQDIKYRKETITDRQGNTIVKEICDVKLVDKGKAAEKIAKHIDFYSADNKSRANAESRVTQVLQNANKEQLNALKSIAQLSNDKD